MKLSRILLFGSLALAALLVGVVILAFNSGVQTWAVRRAVAAQPDFKMEIGRVSVGLDRVEITQVRLLRPGLSLTLPSATIDLSVVQAAGKKVFIKRLHSHGWTLDLTAPEIFASGVPAAPRALAGYVAVLSSASAAPAQRAEAFSGIFDLLRLPVEFSIDQADLAGEVIFPTGAGQPPARAKVTLTGGQLGGGREGLFQLVADAVLTGAVTSLSARSDILVRMDTGTSIDRLTMSTDAAAVGAQFPAGAKLKSNLLAERGSSGAENYRLVIEGDGKTLVDLQAQLPAGAVHLGGRVALAVRDTDLSPFTLGRELPAFAAKVDAKFGVTTLFNAFNAEGSLEVVTSRLEVIQAQLGPVGTLTVSSTFAFEYTGELVQVNVLQARVASTVPLASIDVRQAFGWVLKSRELKVADPSRELVSISLEGVPLAWAQPFLPDLVLAGGDIRGSFLVQAAAGGFSVRPQVPLTFSPFSVSQAGKPLLRNLGATLNVSADVTPKGWQADVSELVVREGAATLLSVSAKAGQVGDGVQPLKTTGRFSVDLPSVLAQPAAAGMVELARGTLRGDFTASLGQTQEIATQLTVSELISGTEEKFPRVSVDLRADLKADGTFAARAPLLIEKEGRKSDLTIEATGKRQTQGVTLDAHLTSTLAHVDDLKILLAPFAAGPPPASAPSVGPTLPDKAPVWQGVSGQLALSMAQVVYSPELTVRDVVGTVKIGEAAVTLEALRAVLGTGGLVNLSGGVGFSNATPQPYALKANLTVSNLDSGSALKAFNPSEGLPMVEGTFNLNSDIVASGPNLAMLAEKARGDVQISSKGGVFRPLPASYIETFVNAKNQLAKRSEQLGALGSLAGALGAKLPPALGGTTNKAQQLVGRMGELESILRLIAEVKFDQLTLDVGGDTNLDTILRDLTITAPELRFVGKGGLKYQPDVPLWKQALSLKLTGAARGRAAEIMKKGNLLGESMDGLGYIPLSMDVNIDGTADNPDTSRLVIALVDKVLGVQLQPGDVERIRQGDVLVLLNLLGQLK